MGNEYRGVLDEARSLAKFYGLDGKVEFEIPNITRRDVVVITHAINHAREQAIREAAPRGCGGYTGVACAKCGQVRVYLRGDWQAVCDACGWLQERGEYAKGVAGR